MALTVSLTGDWMASSGSQRATSGTITFDSSYATGGESLTAANVGLGTISFIEFNQGSSGYTFAYDYSTNKVKVYHSAGFTPAGTNSAPTITTTTNATTTAPVYTVGGALTQTTGASGITGVQAPTFTGTAVSAAALVEVANGVDLGSVSVAFRALGI